MRLVIIMFFFAFCTTPAIAQQGEKISERIERLKADKARLLNQIAEIDMAIVKLNPVNNKEVSMKISLTSVPVDDPVKAFKFYTEVLGFVEKMYQPEAHLAIVASPQEPNGTSLLLEPRGSSFFKTFQESVYNAGLPIIVFGVEDIQAEYNRLKELGVEFKSEPTKNEYGTMVLFKDTCGNFIQLHQQ